MIDFKLPLQEGTSGLRVGAQATVVVLTGSNPLINTLARFQIWLNSILTYAY